jgi:homoserine dehydrogenase
MISVAILGFGVVGSGVAEVLSRNAEKITRNAAQEIVLKYILDIRDFPESPYKDFFVKDFSVIEKDPEVQIVVETIGGASIAYDFTKRAILAGKSVVTSNKELVATHGHELLKLALENNVNYMFEASVGGGIPIIRPISQCLAANEIMELYGILNGTTNYILTQMIQNGASFESALKEAQAKGFAEANPASDVQGTDACRKICILASLSFGNQVYPESVPTEGIEKISLTDVDFAKCAGGKIKLLGRAVMREDGKIACYVAPHIIGENNLLSGVEGVFNGIVVRGNAIGEVMFYGPGAGKLPTASAVVADVIDASKHMLARKYVFWEDAREGLMFDPALIETRWYIRTSKGISDAKKVFGKISALVSENAEYETGFITERMSKIAVEELLKGFPALSLMRVLD